MQSISIKQFSSKEVVQFSTRGLKDAFVTFKYIVFQQGYGSSTSIDFEGSAILKPVPGGYDGNGTGFYRAVDIGPVNDPCTDNTRNTYSGTMPFMVHAQYSIDNSVTGGPDNLEGLLFPPILLPSSIVQVQITKVMSPIVY